MKIDIDIMEAAADSASDLLKALANRHRLLIICQLVDGERSVGELAQFLGLRDSTVSQHLALLRKDGLVSARRDAQTIYYSIASEPAREILAALYRVYCTPAQGKTAQKHKQLRESERRCLEASQSPRWKCRQNEIRKRAVAIR